MDLRNVVQVRCLCEFKVPSGSLNRYPSIASRAIRPLPGSLSTTWIAAPKSSHAWVPGSEVSKNAEKSRLITSVCSSLLAPRSPLRRVALELWAAFQGAAKIVLRLEHAHTGSSFVSAA